MLEMNDEFTDTAFEWSEVRLTTHFLTALGKHERALVDGYRSSRTEKDWKTNFEDNWTAVSKLLESKNDESDDLDGASCLLMAYLPIAMSADDSTQIIMIAIARSS